MKRFIATLLVLIFMIGMLPADALAVEDNFTLSEKQVQSIIKLSGATGSPYRAGTKFSPSMTAYQAGACLEDLRDHELAYVINDCETLIAELERHPEWDDGSYGKVYEMRANATGISQRLDALIFNLEAEVNAVVTSAALIGTAEAGKTEKAQAYRRLRKAKKNIEALMKEAGDCYTPFARDLTAMAADLEGMHASHADINDDPASAMVCTSLASDPDFHFVVMAKDQVGFVIRDADGKYIEGAELYLEGVDSDNKGKNQTKKSIDQGVALFDRGFFKFNDKNRMQGRLVVKMNGFRTYESQFIDLEGGEHYDIYLTKDDGENYIRYASFQKLDIMHEQDTVWYVRTNTKQQPLVVGVETKPGKNSVLRLDYTSMVTGKPDSIVKTITGDGTVKNLDISDQWCRIFMPNTPVTITLTGESGSTQTIDKGIIVKKGVVDAPLSEPLSSNGLPGVNIGSSIPVSMGKIKSIDVNLKIPWEQLIPLKGMGALAISSIIKPNGDFAMGIAASAVRKIATEEGKSDEWATNNSKSQCESWKAFLCENKSLMNLTNQGIFDMAQKSRFIDMCKISVLFNFTANATGTVEDQSHKQGVQLPNIGKLNLFFAIAGDLSGSFDVPFTLGPIPAFAGATIGVGVQVAATLDFSFETESGSAMKFDKWRNVEFEERTAEIAITPRVSFAVYAGVGVKGLLAFYIRGYAGIQGTFHFYLKRSDVFHTSWRLNAGVEAIGELLFFTAKATVVKGEWPKKSAAEPKSAYASEAEALLHEPVPYSQVSAKEINYPSSYEKGKKVKRFPWKEGKDKDAPGTFIEISIQERQIKGVKREWLSVCEIAPNETGEKVIRRIDDDTWGRYLRDNDDCYLYDFEVASIDYVPVINKQVRHIGFITIVALFARHSEDIAENKPGKTYCQVYTVNLTIRDEVYVRQHVIGIRGDLGPMTHVNVTMNYEFRSEHWGRGYNITTSYMQGNRMFYDSFFATLEWYDEPSFEKERLYAYEILHGEKNPDDILELEVYKPRSSSEVYIAYISKSTGEGVFKTGRFYEEENQEKYGSGISYTLSGDIRQFIRLNNLEMEIPDDPRPFVLPAIFVFLRSPDETGRCMVSIAERKSYDVSDKYITHDLGVRLNPAEVSIVRLESSIALYYVQQTTVDNDPAKTSYEVMAIYMAPGNTKEMYSTKPFHMGVFGKNTVPADSAIVNFNVYREKKYGYLHGIMDVKTGDIDKPDTKTHYARVYENIAVNLRATAIKTPLLKPGETGDLLFTVANPGNIPVSKFVLTARAVSRKDKKEYDLANIVVNCVNPQDCEVSTFDKDGKMTTLKGSAAVSQFDNYAVDNEDKGMFVVGNSKEVKAYATTVLMPDEQHTYRATFVVPRNAESDTYDVYLTISEISTMARMTEEGNYESASFWASLLAEEGSESSVKKAIDSNEFAEITAVVDQSAASGIYGSDESVAAPVQLLINGEDTENINDIDPEIALGAYSNTTAVNAREIDLKYGDLALDAILQRFDHEDYAHILIRNATGMPVSDMTIIAELDGVETKRVSLDGRSIDWRYVFSIDVPIDKLTGGKKGDELVIRVESDIHDVSDYNNQSSIHMNSNLMIAGQPKDQFVYEKHRATYQVVVRGGTQPYRYQWQYQDPVSGEWHMIEGANEAILTIEKVRMEQNGCHVRCLIMDADGGKLISNPALLVVRPLPDTGSETDLPMWTAVMVFAALGVVLLMILRGKARKH